MDIKELEILLKDTKYESFINSAKYVEINGNIYKDLFKIGNKNTGYFAVKIRKNDKKHIFQSIENMEIINDRDNFINTYKEIIIKGDYVIMVSDWLNGFQPIYNNNRKYLSKFFSLLGHFNKQNISKGPYTSMYADGNYFETVDDLLKWEINNHIKYIQDFNEKNIIMEILKFLKDGLSCIILEDMNTGNLFITDDGKYKIIDTEWMIKGLNLYQFEKLNYFTLEKKEWYNITDEAKECYTAYFETLGVKTEEANEQIRAFELLQVLRTNSNKRSFMINIDEKIKKQINIVMNQEKYI